ncbi:MAG: hypothetical protein MJ231_03555, partial [bacterium]|nr:hypothetical protein [bacterium]
TMGNMENLNSFFENLYANGMKYVYDGTFTSEGLEGIHFQYALRWAQRNPQTQYWFRMSSLKSAPLGLGVVPKNKENLRHRVINSPVIFNEQTQVIEKNKDYNPNKETYFQIYDASQVSDKQLEDLDKVIRTYENIKSGSELDYVSHDDTMMSYVFQIDPKEYEAQLNELRDFNKTSGHHIAENTPEGTIFVSQFSNFKLTKKTEGGFVAWDANTDMVKMNYGLSGYDDKINQTIVNPNERDYVTKLQTRGSKEVQDMAIQAGKYWTAKVREIQTLYTARALGKAQTANEIRNLIMHNILPGEVMLSDEAIKNVLDGFYSFAPKCVDEKDDVTVRAMMNLPLDSLEFAENTQGVLSTSYFMNRATTDETIGVSRFDLMKQNNPHLVNEYKSTYLKVNDLFNNELKNFADSVIEKVNETSSEKLLDESGNYTEYGEYVIELLGKDIAKYALLKSLSGEHFKTKIIRGGEITYDYDAIRKNTSLKALGINADSPESEAKLLEHKISKGLTKLNDDDISYVANAVIKRIAGTDTMSFRLAEAMVDKAAKGLDWRLDAAKDVMDQDAVRNGENDFDDTWTGVIEFWKKFVQAVKAENPNSYIVAEITDIDYLMQDNFGQKANPYDGGTNVGGVFNGTPEAMIKFLSETGITSEAGYAYFFTNLLESFSSQFEKYEIDENHNAFMRRLEYLMNNRSVDYIRNLYTFIGNHDKPRMIHGMALDMGLFHSDLARGSHSQRLDAIRAMSGSMNFKDIPLELRLNVDNVDYFCISSGRAAAMSKAVLDAVSELPSNIATEDEKTILSNAVADLNNGSYLGAGEKLELIKEPALASIGGAVQAIIEMATNHGLNLNQTEIADLVQEVEKLASTEEMLDKYAVRGGFTWQGEDGDRCRRLASQFTSETNPDALKYNYSLYSMSIAGLLKEAFENTGFAKNSTISSAINSALKDYVEKYNKAAIDNLRKELPRMETFQNAMRKNGYAAATFENVAKMIIKQAEYTSGKTISHKQEIIEAINQIITEPAIEKATMMMKFMAALPGICTMYSGDEKGQSGYDEKAKNIYLQNRNATKWEGVNDYIDKVTYLMNGAFSSRNDVDLCALNNGTPYSLVTSNEKIPAYLMQDDEGNAVISIFNASEIEHANRFNYFEKYGLTTEEARKKFFEENNIETINEHNPYVPIQKAVEINPILLAAGVAIPVGTIFRNADIRDTAQYVVKRIGNRLGIVREGGKFILDGKTAKNGVMILKKAAKQVTFKGHNGQYNFVSNPYAKKEAAVEGEKLSIIAG